MVTIIFSPFLLLSWSLLFILFPNYFLKIILLHRGRRFEKMIHSGQQCAEASLHHLMRNHFPTLCSVVLCWQLAISHSGSIYTMEIFKHYESGRPTPPRQMVVKHLPAHLWLSITYAQCATDLQDLHAPSLVNTPFKW